MVSELEVFYDLGFPYIPDWYTCVGSAELYSEDVDSTISVDNPQNSSISKDGDSLGKSDKPKSSKNDSLLSPSNLKRIISSEKRAMEKIKSLTRNEKKRIQKFQKQKDS